MFSTTRNPDAAVTLAKAPESCAAGQVATPLAGVDGCRNRAGDCALGRRALVMISGRLERHLARKSRNPQLLSPFIQSAFGFERWITHSLPRLSRTKALSPGAKRDLSAIADAIPIACRVDLIVTPAEACTATCGNYPGIIRRVGPGPRGTSVALDAVFCDHSVAVVLAIDIDSCQGRLYSQRIRLLSLRVTKSSRLVQSSISSESRYRHLQQLLSEFCARIAIDCRSAQRVPHALLKAAQRGAPADRLSSSAAAQLL